MEGASSEKRASRGPAQLIGHSNVGIVLAIDVVTQQRKMQESNHMATQRMLDWTLRVATFESEGVHCLKMKRVWCIFEHELSGKS